MNKDDFFFLKVPVNVSPASLAWWSFYHSRLLDVCECECVNEGDQVVRVHLDFLKPSDRFLTKDSLRN